MIPNNPEEIEIKATTRGDWSGKSLIVLPDTPGMPAVHGISAYSGDRFRYNQLPVQPGVAERVELVDPQYKFIKE